MKTYSPILFLLLVGMIIISSCKKEDVKKPADNTPHYLVVTTGYAHSDSTIYKFDAKEKLTDIYYSNGWHTIYSYADSSILATEYDTSNLVHEISTGLLNENGYFYKTETNPGSNWTSGTYTYDSSGFLVQEQSSKRYYYQYSDGNLINVGGQTGPGEFLSTFTYYAGLNYKPYPAFIMPRYLIGINPSLPFGATLYYPFASAPYYGKKGKQLISSCLYQDWSMEVDNSYTVSYTYQINAEGYVTQQTQTFDNSKDTILTTFEYH